MEGLSKRRNRRDGGIVEVEDLSTRAKPKDAPDCGSRIWHLDLLRKHRICNVQYVQSLAQSA